MAKIRFNRQSFEKEFKLDEKTLSRLNLFGTTVETLDAEELELEIPANRPDLFSLKGLIRAFRAFEGKKNSMQSYKRINAKEYIVFVDKSVKAIWPHTSCAIVKGLSLTTGDVQELVSLQEKLSATLGRNRKKAGIGIYPLDKITFPITYEARKPADIIFQPLGSQKPITAEHILQKHPVGKEYASVLKNAIRYPIFVDAHKRIMSMPPIINSEETGRVTEKTKEVFIECSGVSKSAVEKMLVIVCAELIDRGGTIYGATIKDEITSITPSFEIRNMKIKKENLEKLLGITFSEKELEKLLARMGLEYKSKEKSVSIPPWRNDILHEVDIAEDALIAYGYNNLEPHIPEIATIGASTCTTAKKSKIQNILNGLGMMELSSLHFITREEAERILEKKPLELENPRTEYAFLRPNLTIPLLRTLAANRDVEYPQHVYEIGTIFYPNAHQDTGIEETEHLVIGITPGNFTKAKQILDYFMRMQGIEYTLKEADVPGLIAGRTGHILINDEVIGHIGEVHPTTLRAWKLKMPLAIIEIKLEPFLKEK
ncbi:MAG: phenylalanine--tRNA ligase subunit beta [Nanoarchaeota archaeon]